MAVQQSGARGSSAEHTTHRAWVVEDMGASVLVEVDAMDEDGVDGIGKRRMVVEKAEIERLNAGQVMPMVDGVMWLEVGTRPTQTPSRYLFFSIDFFLIGARMHAMHVYACTRARTK